MSLITKEETHDTIYHHVHISPKHIIIAVIVASTIIGAGVWFASGMTTGSRADYAGTGMGYGAYLDCANHQAACGRENGLSRPKFKRNSQAAPKKTLDYTIIDDTANASYIVTINGVTYTCTNTATKCIDSRNNTLPDDIAAQLVRDLYSQEIRNHVTPGL